MSNPGMWVVGRRRRARAMLSVSSAPAHARRETQRQILRVHSMGEAHRQGLQTLYAHPCLCASLATLNASLPCITCNALSARGDSSAVRSHVDLWHAMMRDPRSLCIQCSRTVRRNRPEQTRPPSPTPDGAADRPSDGLTASPPARPPTQPAVRRPIRSTAQPPDRCRKSKEPLSAERYNGTTNCLSSQCRQKVMTKARAHIRRHHGDGGR